MEVDGPGVLLSVGVPLVVATTVTVLLRRRARCRARLVGTWALIALLAASALVTMFSNGVLVAPSVVPLAGAARLASRPSRPGGVAAGRADA